MWLDHAFREFLTSEVLKKVDLNKCDAYIKLAIEAAMQNLCSKTTPIQLLSDMFDILTLDQCETLFSTIERNIALWKSEEFFAHIRNNLLRICNGLYFTLLLLLWIASFWNSSFFRSPSKTVSISKYGILWKNSSISGQILSRF